VFELDLMGTFSTDGGATWSPEVDFNDGRLDPGIANTCRFCGSDAVSNQTCGTMACPAPGTTRIGEYNGVAYGECTLHAVWADDATCNGDYDTFYDRDPNLGGDTAAPSVVCPADRDVGCTDPVDPSATGTAAATDVCDLDPAVSFDDDVLPGNCPVGKVRERIERTWTATDAAGNDASCEQTISIVDADPPAVSCAVAVDTLWPPNHKFVDVGFTFSAADVCDTTPLAVAIAVTSDEPTSKAAGAGGGSHCPDAIVGPDRSVRLRSERSGPRDGRVYRVTVTATDSCGNAASCSAEVRVQHDRRRAAVDSGQLYDATVCN
jgi:hypothetical protein